MKPTHSLPPIDPNQRYTIDETLQYLRTSRQTLYRLIGSGQLPTITNGRRRYVPGSAIVNASAAPASAA